MGTEKSNYYTSYDLKKALQSLAGTSIAQGNSANVNSTMSAPGSGAPISGKPATLADIPIGVRYGGHIYRIDLNKIHT